LTGLAAAINIRRGRAPAFPWPASRRLGPVPPHDGAGGQHNKKTIAEPGRAPIQFA
jgi:hypothetical protein